MIIPAEAIVFDLDGVLANSIIMVETAYRLWANELDLDVKTVIDLTHGRRKPEILRALDSISKRPLDHPHEIRRLMDIETERLSDVLPISGASEFVGSLPPGSWAIATSGERELAIGRLRQVHMPVPACIVASEDVVFGKPDPACYLQAAQAIGASPAGCIVFEDAPLGIEAALAAGMTPIGVTTTYPAEELGRAMVTIPDFRNVSAQLMQGRLHSVTITPGD